MNRSLVYGVLVAVLVVSLVLFVLTRSGTQRSVPQSIPIVPAITTLSPEATSAAAEDVATVFLDSGNYYFKPNTLRLKKNQKVTVRFTNTGIHTFMVDELGINEPLRGASGTFSFTPTRVGTFPFYCAVPGHRERGQIGTLVVEE